MPELKCFETVLRQAISNRNYCTDNSLPLRRAGGRRGESQNCLISASKAPQKTINIEQNPEGRCGIWPENRVLRQKAAEFTFPVQSVSKRRMPPMARHALAGASCLMRRANCWTATCPSCPTSPENRASGAGKHGIPRIVGQPPPNSENGPTNRPQQI